MQSLTIVHVCQLCLREYDNRDEAIQCWRRCADAGGVSEEREP